MVSHVMQNISNKTTVAEVIADKFIQSLENGVAPWQKPWNSLNPHNAETKRIYSGVNAFMLSFFGNDNAFLTFSQIKRLGGNLEKGTKGLPIVFYKRVSKIEEGEEKSFLIARYFTVFPLSKCGLENVIKREGLNLVFNPVEKAEEVLSNNTCPINHGGSRSFYRPSSHDITLPLKESFKTVANYYATLFHEVGHSLAEKHEGGKESYAKEELVAELFSSIALQHCNLLGDVIFENSASYLSSWLGELKNDKKLIISASAEAWRRWAKLTGGDDKEGEGDETE